MRFYKERGRDTAATGRVRCAPVWSVLGQKNLEICLDGDMVLAATGRRTREATVACPQGRRPGDGPADGGVRQFVRELGTQSRKFRYPGVSF